MANIARLISFILLPCYLYGCQGLLGKSEDALGLGVEIVDWHQQQKNCSPQALANNDCPTFIFKGVTFKNEPLLNELIEQRLLQLINAHDTSLWDYQRGYLARANEGDHIHFSATIKEQTSTLVVIELIVKERHTTDMYSPIKTDFINFNKSTKKDLQLADIIESDKIPAFWTTAQVIYKQWLEFNQLLNNTTFQEDWPFIKTQQVALLPYGVRLKYEANTLAPYAMGTPTLVIPYNTLEGIIKPQYVPH